LEKDAADELPLLVPELLPSGICAVGISTQELLDCGRPDIVIRTAEICALIEVKLNPGRGFTVHQEIIGCEDPDIETYVSYLDRQNVSHKRLMFLVPADWANREERKASFAEVKKAYRKIEIGVFFGRRFSVPSRRMSTRSYKSSKRSCRADSACSNFRRRRRK
jgi:hypothetical protein